jgi:hypothetical protein
MVLVAVGIIAFLTEGNFNCACAEKAIVVQAITRVKDTYFMSMDLKN